MLFSALLFAVDRPNAYAQNGSLESLNEQLVELYRRGQYAAATIVAEQAIRVIEQAPVSDASVTAVTYNQVGLLFKATGRHKEAEQLFAGSLAKFEKSLGHDHPMVAMVLSNLAELNRVQSRYAEAEPRFERALLIYKQARIYDHPSVASMLGNFGSLYMALGRYVEAEQLYKRSLAIIEKLFGPNDNSVATLLNNLADLYRTQGRDAEAEQLYNRSLAITELALGPANSSVATILNNLASLYEAQSEYAKAEEFYKRSLAIIETEHGLNHESAATTLHNLAGLYSTQGRYIEAEQLYKRSLAIVAEPRGADLRLAPTLNNLGSVRRAQHRYTEAERLFMDSLAIFEKTLGTDHPMVATVLSNLGSVYEAQGRYGKAAPLVERGLVITEKSLGPEHAYVGRSLAILAKIYEKLGRRADAAALLKRRALLPKEGTRHVKFYFSTNRNEVSSGSYGLGISQNLTFGSVVMLAPNRIVNSRAKRIGQSLGLLERANTGKLSTADLFEPVRTDAFDTFREFAKAATASQKRAARFKKQILVFVHGYNTSFKSAMKRASQIAFDLDFDGILIPFIWPSQGTIAGYVSDQLMAERSVDQFATFLTDLKQALPDAEIHMLAHSMGNQVSLQALCRIAKGTEEVLPIFGEVISAHADVNPADFNKLAKCSNPIVRGITLYVNENDTALSARCGGRLCKAGNKARGYSAANVIDITAMSSGFWPSLTKGFDHDIFVRNPVLFGDIARLLLTGQRPVEERTREFQPIMDDRVRTFWTYNKLFDPAIRPFEIVED